MRVGKARKGSHEGGQEQVLWVGKGSNTQTKKSGIWCSILIEQMPKYLNLFSWLIPDSQKFPGESFREDYVRDADQPTDVRKRPTDVRGIMKKPYLPQHRRLHWDYQRWIQTRQEGIERDTGSHADLWSNL